jgi:UDP-3-O-[3-hydroxymyristoyl] glucosamine N-acyltransferase
LRVSSVDSAIATLLQHIAPPEDLPELGIADSASVDPTATIGQQVRIGSCVVVGPGCVVGDETSLLPGVVLGRGVTVGRQCVLQENVAVRHGCVVGDRVRLGAGTAVGGDGFGYHFADGVHHKIVHAGTVVIESDVELGALCSVDRAKWGQTVIGSGSKLDSLCQVAHNAQLGRGVLMAAQSSIGGSAVIGDYCVFGGHVAIRDNIEIAAQTQVGGGSGVTQTITEPGQTFGGLPARPFANYMREHLALSRLPDLIRTVRNLKKKLN